MKNLKNLVIIAIIAVIGFALVACDNNGDDPKGGGFRSSAAARFRNKAFSPTLAAVTPASILGSGTPANASVSASRSIAQNITPLSTDTEPVMPIEKFPFSHTGGSLIGDDEDDDSLLAIYESTQAYLQEEKTRTLDHFVNYMEWVTEPNKRFRNGQYIGQYTETDGNYNIYIEDQYSYTYDGARTTRNEKASISILANGATALFKQTQNTATANRGAVSETIFSVFTNTAYTYLSIYSEEREGITFHEIVNMTFDFGGNEKMGRIIRAESNNHIGGGRINMVYFEGDDSDAVFYNRIGGPREWLSFSVIKDGLGVTYRYRTDPQFPEDSMIIDLGVISNIQELVFNPDAGSTMNNGEAFWHDIIGFNLTGGTEIRFEKEYLELGGHWRGAVIEDTYVNVSADQIKNYTGQLGPWGSSSDFIAVIYTQDNIGSRPVHDWINYNGGGINNWLNTIFSSSGLSMSWASEWDTMYNGFSTYFDGWYLDFDDNDVKAIEVNQGNAPELVNALNAYIATFIQANYDGEIFDVLEELTEE